MAWVVSPNATDAELAVSFLGENGIAARPAGSVRNVLPMLDDGIGCLILVEEALLAEDLPALREALQANPTLERSRGGLGMGLTIVRRLAMLHDGLVQAASDGPGKGACFAVRIPWASAAIKVPPVPERRGGEARRLRHPPVEARGPGDPGGLAGVKGSLPSHSLAQYAG